MLGPRGKADTGPSGHLPWDRADQYAGVWGADRPPPPPRVMLQSGTRVSGPWNPVSVLLA